MFCSFYRNSEYHLPVSSLQPQYTHSRYLKSQNTRMAEVTNCLLRPFGSELSRTLRLTHFTCWQCWQTRMPLAFFATRMHCLLIKLPVHQNSQDSSLRYIFLATWFPVGRDAWVCSFSDAGLHIPPCWTSWDPSWLDSPVCWGLSEWQHTHLVYQSLLTVLYHPLTCWRS